ncbi:unnamed protein product [Orchesella dallaii]|uniref:Ectonucleotide pyrophosphatase/phosphodiesterase family member 6 n=1 Tax=Orchesella dallaii TaxID=48710 RepID=A0ABP1Q7H3_9HEXA
METCGNPRSIFQFLVVVGITLSFLCNLPTTHAEPSTSRNDTKKENGPPQKLLIIMLDGFRWDYYDRQKEELPGFSEFLSKGVQAQWLEPSFPSNSYACWTTISTGVYPEVHGILDNFMFDQQFQAVFDFKNETSVSIEHWWQNVEPIWITATRHGRKALLHRWSSCDVPFDGLEPETCMSYYQHLNQSIEEGYSDTEEADLDAFRIAFQGLQLDYDIIMVYVESIDKFGHAYGPDSPELMEAVRHVDNALSLLLQEIKNAGLENNVNTVIIGDHGSTFVGQGSGTKIVQLSDYINASQVYKIVGKGAVVGIVPYAQTKKKVYQSLKGGVGFDTYLREEIPENFHYKKSKLVPEILLVAQPNYLILRLGDGEKQIPDDEPPAMKQRFKHFIPDGIHGYSNMTDMRTIFFAKGPAFKEGVAHPPIEMVDLYQIFTHLLDIPSNPNNGSWPRVSNMFSSALPTKTVSNLWIITTITFSTLFIISLNFNSIFIQ